MVCKSIFIFTSDCRSALPLCLQRIFRKLKTFGSSFRGDNYQTDIPGKRTLIPNRLKKPVRRGGFN